MQKRIFLCFWGFFLLLQSVSLTAQTQISENYLVTGPWNDYVAPMKYSYTVSDEGERIMNGPISISGRQNETYGNVTITGSYVLNASAKTGKLNGAMSVKANYHGVKKLLRGQQVEDYAYSFSGSFLNGVPNGTFAAKATNFGSSNVSYKNGRLVGAYNVQEVIDDRILNIKGAFNDSGKMIGQWRIEILGDVSVWEFVNGIRIRESSESSESTPKQIEMAKRYASGAISDEELETEGYFPVQDSICLGDYASDLYFLKFMADWDKLPNYDFKTGFWVKYTYLYNILPLPEGEFEKILTNYKEYGEAPLPVSIDEKTKCYITHYYVNYGSPSVKLNKRRFSNEQVAKVKEAVDYYCRNNPLSIVNLFYHQNLGSDMAGKALNVRTRYENLKDDNKLRAYYSDYVSRFDINSAKRKNYDSLVEDIGIVGKALREQLNGKEMTSDGLFYIFPDGITARYFSVDSLNVFNSMEKEVRDYGEALNRQLEEERIAKEKKLEQEEAARKETAENKKKEIAQVFRERLSGIEKQSAKKVTEQLNSMSVKMGYGYYDRVPKNSLNITMAELAEAIAPVIECGIIDIIEEESGGYGTYKITMEFKKKKETVPVSMSITNNGNIIDGSITLPQDILDVARNNTKNKQAVSKALSNIFR